MKTVYQWNLVPESQLHPTAARQATEVKRFIAIGNCWGGDRCSEIYFSVSNKWKIFEEFKCERNDLRSIAVGNDIFIVGGCLSDYKEALDCVSQTH